jgi:hypothetical protein
MPADIVAEGRRKPKIQGETGIEIAGNLVDQAHRKNSAINRAAKFYAACRKT